MFAVGRGRQEHQPSLPPSINVYLVSLNSLLVTGAAAPWFKVWCCATQLLFWASFPFAGVLVGMPLYGAGRPRPHWEAVEPYPAFALARPRPRPNLGLDREKYLLEGCEKPLPAGIELPLKQPALRLCKGGLPGPVRGCDDFAAKQAVAVLAEVSADVVRSGAARSFWVKPGCRAKSWEEEQWQALARTWVGYLQPLLNSSPFFQDLGELAEGCLIRVLRTKAAGTLRRHLPGFKLWVDFIHGTDLETPFARADLLVNFFDCVQAKHRSAIAPWRSLKFVAALLGWDRLLATLANPVVVACSGDAAESKERKEAVPLPLYAVARMEAAVLAALASGPQLDPPTLMCVVFLVMLWGALRFSDAQRVAVPEMDFVQGIVRCRCWKTKSSKTSMPWGCLTVGIYDDWTAAVKLLREKLGEVDFLIPGPFGGRASFTYTQAQLRRLLVCVAKVPEYAVSIYTLRSLKVTGLCWGLQLDIDGRCRRLWGHHRAREAGEAMVQKYGRDDVLPALRAQLVVARAIRGGWCPLTPQARGARQPCPEEPLAPAPSALRGAPLGLDICASGTSDTESESDENESEVESSVSSVCGELLEADDEEDVVPGPAQLVGGKFLVNCRSHKFHAVILAGGSLRRACAPSQSVDEPHWEVRSEDPSTSIGAFIPCSHAACGLLLGAE